MQRLAVVQLAEQDPATQPAIVVGSQYRITFALDTNGNRKIDVGEVVTYFLDPSTSDPLVNSSPNPYDFVLRRRTGTVADSIPPPVSGTTTRRRPGSTPIT